MTIPQNPQTEKIHRLTRELEQAQAQLTLALARYHTIADELTAAKAMLPTAPPLTDEQAAIEAVCRLVEVPL